VRQATAYLYWTNAEGTYERAGLGEAPVTVGSDERCDVRPAADELAAVHVALVPTPEGHTVRKITRTRSLVVNDAEVARQALRHGDRITLGELELLYVTVPAPGDPTLELLFGREDSDIQVDLVVGGPSIVLGFDDGDIRVADPSVSSRHLKIENYGPGLVWARDLGSTNGSKLNDEPLDGRRLLEPGDTLEIGRVTVLVSEGPEGEVPSEPRTVSFEPDQAMA